MINNYAMLISDLKLFLDKDVTIWSSDGEMAKAKTIFVDEKDNARFYL